jgi:hypothetical protein
MDADSKIAALEAGKKIGVAGEDGSPPITDDESVTITIPHKSASI